MNPLFFTIFKIFLILTMLFLIGKSYYTNKEASKSGKPEKVIMYSGIGLINIAFLLVILFIPLSHVLKSGGNLLDFNNLYLLLFLLFIIYQVYVSTRLLLYKDGILVMGQYFKYNKIKKIRIDNGKLGQTVMMLTPTGGVSFKISKKDENKLREIIKLNRIQLVQFNN